MTAIVRGRCASTRRAKVRSSTRLMVPVLISTRDAVTLRPQPSLAAAEPAVAARAAAVFPSATQRTLELRELARESHLPPRKLVPSSSPAHGHDREEPAPAQKAPVSGEVRGEVRGDKKAHFRTRAPRTGARSRVHGQRELIAPPPCQASAVQGPRPAERKRRKRTWWRRFGFRFVFFWFCGS